MNTVDLAFEAFGEQHDGAPLLILHGFFASSRNWRSLARRLASERKVYVLDMRNHGVSPHAERMDYPAMVADVLAFMAGQGIARAHLLGHSMGGKIAMCLALQYPERVEKLLVADISPVSYQHSFDNIVNALKNLSLDALRSRKQAEECLAAAIPELHYRQFLLQNLLLCEGRYFWRLNLDYFQQNAPYIVAFPELAAVAAYQAPVLFLSGESSGYIRREAIERWFPLATITEIEGTGHSLHVDAPERFCREVNGWLGR